MRTHLLQAPALALILLLIAAPSAVHADVSYTFTKIADSTDPGFAHFANAGPAINDEGLVSFLGCSSAMGDPVSICAFYTLHRGWSLDNHVADAVQRFEQPTILKSP